MANSWFQFKQFLIKQGDCAMKVSTDACILGAFAPIPATAQYGLDIGSGTGLLSLMLAQRSSALQIDALEIDTAAAKQAQENFQASPWAERLHITEQDAKRFLPEKKYECIISNPPYFSNSLRDGHAQRMQARHDDGLPHEQLATIIKRDLAPQGYATVMLPPQTFDRWLNICAASGLYTQTILHVFSTPRKAQPLCSIAVSGHEAVNTEIKTLLIKDSANQYTTSFSELMQDYYLHL